MRHLVGHKKDVRAVAYLPDGRLVSGGSDRTVRVWHPLNGECLHTLKAKGPVYAVAATPNGTAVAFAGRYAPRATSNTVTICDAETFRIIERKEIQTYDDVYRFDRATLQSNRTRELVPRSIWVLTYSQDGTYLVAVSRKLGAGNWPNGAGGYWWQLTRPNNHGPLPWEDCFTAEFSPAGHQLAITGRQRILFTNMPDHLSNSSEYPLKLDWAAAIRFSPAGDRAVVGAGQSLLFYDLASGKQVRRVKTGVRVNALAVEPSGRVILAGGFPKCVEVFDLGTGTKLSAFDFDVGSVNALAFAPDGLTFAVAGDRGLVVCDADW